MSEKDKAKVVDGFKIDVRTYKVKVADFDEATGRIKTEKGRPVMIDDDFDVKGSLCDILFNRDLQLKPEEMFKSYDLCVKIRSATDFLILDSEEYRKIKQAYDALKGGSENMIEFLKRIRDAEKVEIGEVKEETPATKEVKDNVASK